MSRKKTPPYVRYADAIWRELEAIGIVPEFATEQDSWANFYGLIAGHVCDAYERGHRDRRAFTCSPEPGDEARYLEAIHDSHGETAEETDENLLAIIKTIIRNTEFRCKEDTPWS